MTVKARMIQLAAPTGTGYEEDWSIKLQGGHVYHTIELETNLANKSTVKKVIIDIGGVPIVTATGQQLEDFEDLLKLEKDAGRLILNLAKHEFASPLSVYQTSLQTGVAEDITLTIEVGAPQDGDPANTPTITGKAYVSINPLARQPRGGRAIQPALYEQTLFSPAAGEYRESFPNGTRNRYLQRLIFDETNVEISRVKFFRGETLVREMTRNDINFALRRYSKMALLPNKLVIDYTMFGSASEQGDAVDTQGLNFEFEVSGQGAIKMLVDGFERIAA